MQQPTMLERLQKLLSHKKSRKFYAQRLGITEWEVEELLKKLRGGAREKVREDSEIGCYISALEERVVEADLEKGILKSSVVLDYEPKTVDELYEIHKIDKVNYRISNYWSKLKSNGKFTSSVFATIRKSTDYNQEEFLNFLHTYEPKPVVVESIRDSAKLLQDVDVVISIADFHLAKKTLENESIASRKEQYMSVLARLILRASSSFVINKLVFVISNDFFHSDNYQGTTTNGTPQDVTAEFDTEYEEGFDLMVSAITYLKEFCSELEVVLVQGNHDRTKSFYLAHALEWFFKSEPSIVFNRQNSTTKHTVLGNTFIGFHHGNCKIDELPLLFATGSTSSDFGNALFKEVHTGDKHYYMAKEVKGVRIQQMPSLSGTDKWHRDNNYVHTIRAALVLIYDPSKGKIGEFEERI